MAASTRRHDDDLFSWIYIRSDHLQIGAVKELKFFKSTSKMSVLRSPIDFANLEEELNEALRADELYHLQNDAKIRAIEQGVPTYEDFRQMVNGAHLKPIEHGGVKLKLRNLWNPVIDTRPREIATHKPTRSVALPKVNGEVPNGNPNSHQEFMMGWKLTSDFERKFEYLWTCRNDLRERIFRAEIPPLLFGETIDVCLKSLLNKENVKRVLDVLLALSSCNRFQLCVTFMTKLEKERCTELFKRLYDCMKTENHLQTDVRSLAKMYNVVLE